MDRGLENVLRPSARGQVQDDRRAEPTNPSRWSGRLRRRLRSDVVHRRLIDHSFRPARLRSDITFRSAATAGSRVRERSSRIACASSAMSINQQRHTNGSGSIGQRVARGAAWVVFGAMVGKLVGVAVQVVLGWVLLPEDFAIYASALGLNLVAAALLDGGIERFLLRSGEAYERVVDAAARLATIANLLAGALVLILAAWIWLSRDDGALAAVLLVMAASAAGRTPVSMERIRLRHAMRFAAVTRVEVVAIVFRGLLSIMLAILGFGPLSLVLPLVASLPMEWWLLRRHSQGLTRHPVDGPRESVRGVLRETRWIIASNTALTLAGRGDYLTLTIAAPAVLGPYFFGFQLVVASLQLFMASFRSVLLPGLSRVGDDPIRIRMVAKRAIGATNLLLTPACAVLALLSPALIHLVWMGRWDDSIVVVQAVALSTAVRAASPVAFALMEARSRWVRVAVLNAMDGASLIAAVLVAVWLFGEDLAAIAWLVAAQRALVGIIIQRSALGTIGVGRVQTMRWLGAGMIATAVGLLLASAAGEWPSAGNVDLRDALIKTALFLLGWACFVGMFERTQVRGLIDLLRRGRSRHVGGDPPS